MTKKKKDKSHRLAPHPCLNCGKVLDAGRATDGEGGKPHPGAISICVYCHHVAAFGDDLQLRELNDEEIVDLAGDDGFKRAMKAFDMLEGLKALAKKRGVDDA